MAPANSSSLPSSRECGSEPRFGRQVHEGAFLAYIATLPVMVPQILGQRAYLSDFVLVVVIVTWTMQWARRRVRLQWDAVHWAIFGYAVALIISGLTSANRTQSLGKLVGTLVLLTGAIVTANLVRDIHVFLRTTNAWMIGCACATVVAVIAIPLYYAGIELPGVIAGPGSLPNWPIPRVAGLHFDYANYFCNYLTFSLAIALAAVKLNFFSRRTGRVLLTLIIVSALFSWSPGLGGIALVLGLWTWLYGRRKRLALVTAIFVAAAFWFVSTVRLFSPAPGRGETMPLLSGRIMPSQRALCWASAFRTFREHPLTGIGLGLPVASVDFLHGNGTLEHLSDAHDTWISVAASSGLLGLIAFIVLLVVIMRGWRLDRGESEHAVILNALWLAIVCGFLYQSIHGGFESARHLWPVIGMSVGLRSAEATPNR